MYSYTKNNFIALLIELKQILEFVPMYPCTQNKFGCNFCLDWGQILKSKISVRIFIERNQNFIEFLFHMPRFEAGFVHVLPWTFVHCTYGAKRTLTYFIEIMRLWYTSPNWTKIGQRWFQSAECCPSAKFGDTPAKQDRVRKTSVLVQFGPNFRFRA